MTSEPSKSPVPMPDGYKRCMEISKGLTRAGMESGSLSRWRLINAVINSFLVVFVVSPSMVFFLSTKNIDESFSFIFEYILFAILLVFLAVLGGLKVFGILGIIYGPLVMTAFLTLTDIYRSSYEIYIRSTTKR